MDYLHDDISKLIRFIDKNGLPDFLQELIEIIGHDGAYRLTQKYGGQIKYVAKSPGRSSMREILSEKELAALCGYYGGETLEIPKADHFYKQVRNIRIMQALASGKSRAQVAKEFSLGIRQIGNIKKEYKHHDYSSITEVMYSRAGHLNI